MKYSDYRAFRKAMEAGPEESSWYDTEYEYRSVSNDIGMTEKYYRVRYTRRMIKFSPGIIRDEAISLLDMHSDELCKLLCADIRGDIIVSYSSPVLIFYIDTEYE